MAIELKMPALSPTMEKGTLARWLVKSGDMVKPGDLLAEIETDKATMEFEAAETGRVSELLVAEGTAEVAVGTVIAVLTADGMPSTSVEEGAKRDEPERVAVTMSASRHAPPSPAIPASAPDIASEPALAPAARRRQSPADRVKVSPLALRIAEAKGIDLSAVSGSGPNGRIVRADLRRGLSALLPSPATPSYDMSLTAPLAATHAAVASPPAGVPVETVKLSSMRRTIARRLTESKQSVPHFYLTARCNLDALLSLRTELNADLARRAIKLSVNDLLIKAMALAMLEVPDANVQFGGGELHRFGRVDIAMAVALEGGLITPVIKDVGALSLSAIATRSKELATLARDGKLLPEDYQGGTASLSNLGMFGIDEMFPVINPPQALILGTAAGIQQPWAVDGKIALATVMAATASFDHRAIDGAIAARFMAAFKDLVETPLRICG